MELSEGISGGGGDEDEVFIKKRKRPTLEQQMRRREKKEANFIEYVVNGVVLTQESISFPICHS